MLILRQNPCAFLDSGTGGEDVVDQNHARRALAAPTLSGAREFDGSTQVLQALFAIEVSLRRGGAYAFQGGDHRQAEKFTEVAGDFLRLVVVTCLFASPVQRHGDERPLFTQCLGKSGIRKSFGSKSREIASEVDAALVFQAMDQSARVIAVQ